jgi:hypothetical protein
MPPLELYPVRFRDPLKGKWIRARREMQAPEHGGVNTMG